MAEEQAGGWVGGTREVLFRAVGHSNPYVCASQAGEERAARGGQVRERGSGNIRGQGKGRRISEQPALKY